MSLRTAVAFGAGVLLVGGSLTAHLGYGLYLRSEAYRRRVEANLSRFFNLPSDVGRCVPLTFAERAFDEVRIWLPDRRDRVFACRRAIWREHAEVPGGSAASGVHLLLRDGALVLGTDKWRLEDYRRVLESGLRHDFGDVRLVRFDEFQMSFRRADLLLAVADAGGSVVFERPDVGVVSMQAHVLNGRRVREPVRIEATFLPDTPRLVSEIVLGIPEVELSGLGLDAALGGAVTRGYFSGQLWYRDAEPAPRVVLSGRLYDVDVAELTKKLPHGPIRGRAEIVLDRADLLGTLPTRVAGRARLTEVRLEDLSRLFGGPPLSGTAEVNVSEADIADAHVRRLVFNARAEGMELVELLRLFGRGQATGTLRVSVNGMRVEGDRIAVGDIEIQAAPAGGRRGTIDRGLLLQAAEHLAGFTLPDWIDPQWLPAQIEYTQFGAHLLINDNRLRVLGTHGSDGKTLLTVRLLGREVGVLREWGGAIDLSPWIAQALERVSDYDPRDVGRRLTRPPPS